MMNLISCKLKQAQKHKLNLLKAKQTISPPNFNCSFAPAGFTFADVTTNFIPLHCMLPKWIFKSMWVSPPHHIFWNNHSFWWTQQKCQSVQTNNRNLASYNIITTFEMFHLAKEGIDYKTRYLFVKDGDFRF